LANLFVKSHPCIAVELSVKLIVLFDNSECGRRQVDLAGTVARHVLPDIEDVAPAECLLEEKKCLIETFGQADYGESLLQIPLGYIRDL
jgi:hypothetical protein